MHISFSFILNSVVIQSFRYVLFLFQCWAMMAPQHRRLLISMTCSLGVAALALDRFCLEVMMDAMHNRSEGSCNALVNRLGYHDSYPALKGEYLYLGPSELC